MKSILSKTMIILTIALSMVSVSLAFNPAVASAKSRDCEERRLLGLPFWHEYISDENCNIGQITDWPLTAGSVAIAFVEILLRIAGMVAVGYIIYGGFRYIVSQGEPDATKAARETILNAVIGLVIAIIATAVVNFIGNMLTRTS